MKYAAQTQVPVDRSRSEIEKTLIKYGADQFIFGWEGQRMMVGFRISKRFIRIALPPPDKDLTEDRQQQQMRQRWRVLLLTIKAKLEAVDSGISSIENEFLAHVMLPNNQVVGDWLRPQIEKSYESGDLPKLLPGAP